MHNQMMILSEEQTNQVNGGHISAAGGMSIFGIVFFLLEVPHIIMGIREFTNYLSERSAQGCQNVDENDTFTRFFCGY